MPLLDLIRTGFCVDNVTFVIWTEKPEMYSTLTPLPELPDELKDITGPIVKEHGREVFAPLLSPNSECRGVLWLQYKSTPSTDHYTFDDRTELDAVMEVARYVGSAIGFRKNLARQEEFEAKLRIQNRLAAGGLFAASVMHDLNTPLAKIMRSIDLLRASPELTPEERDHEHFSSSRTRTGHLN